MATDKQKTLLTLWTIWQYLEAAILIVVGILTAVYASNTDYKTFVAILIAVLIILDGLFRLGLYYTSHLVSSVALLLIGVFEITIGIYICILNSGVIDMFAEIVTILLLTAGVSLIPDGVLKLQRPERDIFLIVLEFVLAAVLIALGITAAITWGTNGDTSIILICVGIFLALMGVGLVVLTSIKLAKGKKLMKGSNIKSTSVTKRN